MITPEVMTLLNLVMAQDGHHVDREGFEDMLTFTVTLLIMFRDIYEKIEVEGASEEEKAAIKKLVELITPAEQYASYLALNGKSFPTLGPNPTFEKEDE